MIGTIFIWWFASTFLGLLAFPLAWRIFNRLPDRGYGISRALGLLLSGYILWMGTSTGILHNNLGGTLGSVILLAVASIAFAWKEWGEIRNWLHQNMKTVITIEALFLVSFVTWSLVRAYTPEIQHTEKPMELAFLNAILNSETFPPKDPWLSGYAISYYYFGYILLAFLTRLTGVLSTEAFNLGNALWFALSILGAYSVLYNLLSVKKNGPRIFAPLLGPVFVFITGNLEVIFDLLHHRHIFWQQLSTGEMVSSFWKWLDLERLAMPPASTPTWMPDRHLWWWQASRVVYDVNLTGKAIEMIDEFPFFSFLLADNHPHLLALPFVLLAIAFAFNVFLSSFNQAYRISQIGRNLQTTRFWASIAGIVVAIGFVQGIVAILFGTADGDAFQSTLRIVILGTVLGVVGGYFALIILGRYEVALPTKDFWLGAWIFGALAFLNTWDFPIYLSLLFIVILWNQWAESGWEFLKRIIPTAYGLVLAGILFYLPWYPTFSSQASGILPNLIFPTRIHQFLIMFGPLIVPLFIWLVRMFREVGPARRTHTPLLIAVLLPLGLFFISLFLGFAAYMIIKDDPVTSGTVFAHLGVLDLPPGDAFLEVIRETFLRRLTGSWTTILLGFMLFMMTGLILQAKSKIKSALNESDLNWIFVIFLIGIGTLLVLGPEFVYLRDSFGHRMNTIFKFYYATWILWGLAAAYAAINLWPKRWMGLESLRSLIILPLLIGLVYPVLSVWTKTNHFNSTYGPTLDGMAYIEIRNPAEYEAIQWINGNVESGIIAEAIGGSYTDYARISTHTGLSTVLGWPGHELQWRGGSEEQGSRQSDIENLYTTRSWQEAKNIVDRYGIDYVYVGPLERNSYKPFDERKFSVFMEPVFQNNEVIIFAVKENGDVP